MIRIPRADFAVDTDSPKDENPAMPPGHRPDDPPPPARRTSSSASPLEDAIPARVALWIHRGGPAGDHLDLFIGPFDPERPPADDARVARSWRLPLDALGADGRAPTGGVWAATPTPPHRALYLTTSASSASRDLGAGRGTAAPLALGEGRAHFGRERTMIRARTLGAAPGALQGELTVEVRVSSDGTSVAEFRIHDGATSRC